MKSVKNKYIAVVLVAVVALFASCSDDPGVDNYYTAKGSMANTYLTNDPDTYSEFVSIIQKSSLVSFDLLGTYGSYTVFAPTNNAVNRYLAGRGLTSVDELTVADCDTIAATHIIENGSYFTTEFSNATLPNANMLDRYLTITCDSDFTYDGKIQIAYYINKSAQIILADDSVENGVVHTVDMIIDATTEMLPDLLAQDSTISLFYQAYQLTGLKDSMMNYIDESYSCDDYDSTEVGHTFSTATEYDNVLYMKKRYYGYTGFIETNDVFASRGINNIDDLRAYAKEVYDDMYPDDADVTDETDRRNSLNRFISYHFLDRRADYSKLTVDNLALNCFDRRHWDVADWYETMMPYSIMKISYPSGSQAGRYVNRRGVQNRKDSRGVFVAGAKILSPSEAAVDQIAVNGVYHYITDIIDYGRNTQEVVLNERMRMDASTLSPDFMTSGARGHSVRGVGGASSRPGEYGVWSNDTNPKTNINTCLGFKAGTAKNFTYSDVTTHLHVRPRYLSFWSYQGDEVTICGMYDITFKLPPVPEGDYEFRLATCIAFSNRGIVQAYLDGAPCGIPLDMRISGDDPSVGWKSDNDLVDDESIMAFDKAMHNRGWMKGPASYGNISQDGTGQPGYFRTYGNTLRRVFATFHSDGKTEHYVRIQQKLESTNGTLAFDYIELCPRSVYNNEFYPEDKY